jgi:hypothetical protein
MNIHDILRKRLEENLSPTHHATEPLNQLQQTEWSPEFERLMRNRLLMGRFRYGLMDDPAKLKNYDMKASMVKRLTLYWETDNQEHLVDLANLCLLEFKHPSNPKAYFESTDESEHNAYRR